MSIHEAPPQGVALMTNPVDHDTHPEWQADLVLDVALGTGDDAILEAYSLQAHTLRNIKAAPLFQAEVARMKKELERDGVSFKLKARLQAEAMLTENWRLVHANATPASVKADLIKSTVRWAGYDGSGSAGVSAGGGAQFSINIVLKEPAPTGLTIEGEQSES